MKLLLALLSLLAVLQPLLAQDELSGEARRVLDYLLEDWEQHMHSTSIPLAMENLGLPADADIRMEVGEYLREHRDIANNTKWWGANNYILSNEEKRIAKYLIFQKEKRDGRQPSLQEASRELGLAAERLSGGLEFMARAGLLEESGENPLGYRLVEQYSRWGGPLRYNYHTITIGDGKPFDVW